MTQANAISLDSFLSAIYDKEKQLTSLQFKAYIPPLKGTKVDWSAKVLNVYSMGILHSVFLDVKGNKFMELDFEIVDKTTALKLNKNQKYNFSGEVEKCRIAAVIQSINYYHCTVTITGFK